MKLSRTLAAALSIPTLVFMSSCGQDVGAPSLAIGTGTTTTTTTTPATTTTTTIPAGTLEVPIEMVDFGLASDGFSAVNFVRTSTSLDQNDFDGSPSYFFEVVASNLNGGSAYNVYLMDTAGTPATMATITVPAGTARRLFRTTFTPNGTNRYTVKLDATAGAGDLKVFTARMLVRQTAATKSAIYIPLLTGPQGSATPLVADSGATVAVGSTSSNTSATIGAGARVLPWLKQSSRYATLGANPFVFEVVGGATGANAHINLSVCGGAAVAASSVLVNGTVVFNQSAPLSNTTDLVDGQSYCVQAYNTASNTTYVFKAGLWVKITSFSKAEVYYRIAQNISALGAGNHDFGRALIDLSLFGTPTAYFEARSAVDNGTSSLLDGGAVDFGGTPSTVGSSTLNWTTSNVTRSGALTLPASRYYLDQSALGEVGAGYVVIQTQ